MAKKPSIFSKVKKFGEKVASGVYNTVNSAASALSKLASQNSKNLGAGVASAPIITTPVKPPGLLYSSTGQPIGSSSVGNIGNVPNATSAITGKPVYIPLGGGAPNATSVLTGQPVYKSGGGSSRSVSPSGSTTEAFSAENMGTESASTPSSFSSGSSSFSSGGSTGGSTGISGGYSGTVTGGNAGLVGGLDNYTLDETGKFVYEAPKTDTTVADPEKGYADIFKQYLGMKQDLNAPNQEKILAKLERDAGLEQKKQEVSNYTGQLNSIVAQSQADALSVTGQGRGIPEAIIGGQQAQIYKEAAIKALPIQALLANAQGNLEMAQQHVDTLFKIRSEDAQAQYKYQSNYIDSLFEFATASQQRKMQAIKDQQKQVLDTKENNAATAKAYSMQALETNPSLAARFMKLDTTSPNFQQELAGLVGQFTVPQKATGGGTVSTSSAGGQYTNDLDAIIGTVLSTIPSKFGQQTFNTQIAKARNDTDKLNIVAAQVLTGQPAEFKNDFRNQAVGIAQLDKAIAEIDKGVQTGVLQSAAQYTYNLLGKDFDPKLAAINNYITSAIQPYRNSVTGAAWGEQEDGEYQQLFGSTKYSPTELRQRLVQTKELLKSKSSEGLNAFVNPLGSYDNSFDTGTLAPAPTQTTTPAQASTGGFWAGVGNWLWGND